MLGVAQFAWVDPVTDSSMVARVNSDGTTSLMETIKDNGDMEVVRLPEGMALVFTSDLWVPVNGKVRVAPKATIERVQNSAGVPTEEYRYIEDGSIFFFYLGEQLTICQRGTKNGLETD